MTQLDYFNYLTTLPELNFIEEATDPNDITDYLYGIFQCFMPSGNNVEKVFTHIPNSNPLLERIRAIYSLTEEKTIKELKNNISPGYFVPDFVETSEAELRKMGEDFINNLKLLASDLNDKEFVEEISNIKDITIVGSREIADSFSDNTTEWIYDAISDWISDSTDYESLLGVLSEAYYSVSCDYWLSYYLQYPAYKNMPDYDFFKPYFELWSKGYICIFNNKGVVIGPY